MNTRLSPRILFAIAFVLLAASNMVVLSGVASNRSGTPEARITLSERELRLPYRFQEENSGLRLQLAWRALGKYEADEQYPDWRSPAWLDAGKLQALGFDIGQHDTAKPVDAWAKRPLPREVFIVLENNGKPYQEALKRAEAALAMEKESCEDERGDQRQQERLEMAARRVRQERVAESRLFAIDAGLDPQALRGEYPDRTRFIIASGVVRPGYRYHGRQKEINGYISRLSVEHIHVPLEYRQVFDAMLRNGQIRRTGGEGPRYQVEVAYGRRLEPWMVSVQPEF